MTDFRQIAHLAQDKKASDIHLTVGIPVTVRMDGVLEPWGDSILDDAYITDVFHQLANESQIKELKELGECDFAVTYDGDVRMRCNAFTQQGHIALALRLNLPSEALKLISATIVALAIGLPAVKAAKKGGNL